MDIIATQLEEGMEVVRPGGKYPVIIEGVVVQGTPRPYVEFYALNGQMFRVRNEEQFTVLS